MQSQVEHLGHRALGIAPPRLDMMQCMNLTRPGLSRDRGQHVLALAAPQDQLRTRLAQVSIEVGE